MKKIFIIVISVICALLFGCTGKDSSSTGNPNEDKITDEVSVLIDVNQFSRISAEELVKIMGEPKSKDEWNNLTSRGKFLIKIYEYDGYNFFIADDAVVRMNIYSDKYYNLDGEGIKFASEEDIFQMLNIPVDYDRIKKVEDTGYALKYSPVSDKVAEVWCIGIDKEKSTIEEIKVTFNLNYF